MDTRGGYPAQRRRQQFERDENAAEVEVVDDQGRPVPDGVAGELVVTNLVSEAMPLVRYRTGDVAAPGTGGCRCGRPQRVLRLVEGRDLAGVELPGGRGGADRAAGPDRPALAGRGPPRQLTPPSGARSRCHPAGRHCPKGKQGRPAGP